jgi:hypothetical protein
MYLIYRIFIIFSIVACAVFAINKDMYGLIFFGFLLLWCTLSVIIEIIQEK